MSVTINEESRVFLFHYDDHYTTQGFDSLYRDLKQISELIDLPFSVSEDQVGTMDQYRQYEEAIRLYAASPASKKTFYAPGTHKKVKSVLDRYIESGDPIRIFYGNEQTGEDWLEEFGAIGKISRSFGPLRIPLMLLEDDIGGLPISSENIVKLVDVNTGDILWKHKKYHLPELRIVESDHQKKEYNYNVLADGQLHASFSDYYKAAAFVAFISGTCTCQLEG